MKAILACTPSGGIGYKGSLPWDKLEGDLPRFKSLTYGKKVIMGGNTFRSLKKALPNRIPLVVTRDPYYDQVQIKDYGADAWVIGGAQIFHEFLPFIQEIHLSVTHSEYKCDTFINRALIERDFKLVSEEILEDHTYQIWTRKTN